MMNKNVSAILMVFCVILFFATTPNLLNAKVAVGEEVTERIESAHPYEGTGAVSWQHRIHSPGAGYIAVHFTEFNLASGDYVEISSPDGRYAYRYSGTGKIVHDERGTISEFWATHIPGPTALVRLVTRGESTGYGFVIDKWAKGYSRDYIKTVLRSLEEDTLMEAICGTDDKQWAKCYDGTTMYEKSKAVCRLLIGGTSACTGWLLGSEGHVITNNHCIGTQAEADSTDYEFMAEGATCTTPCDTWGACPGTVEASSGTLVKTDADLDYTLILLPTNVTPTYGFLQFRDTLPNIGEEIYIPQHPNAYGKQLAVTSDTNGPNATVHSLDETPCAGGPGDIGYYADTEGGSSGSPVLATYDNLVVALHHCANCPNRGVPIPAIIAHMGVDIPADAIGVSIPQPPVANFTADKTTIQVGGSIQFSDISLNVPTSWDWTFEGGDPATSPDQHPLVTYDTVGTYSVTLTVANGLGNDTMTKTDYITVQEGPIYCTSAGDTYSSEWIAEVQIGDFVNASDAAGYTDFTGLTVQLTADESYDVNLTPGFSGSSYTEYWKIWIDYNKDGDFDDAGEEMFGGSGSIPVSGTMYVPADAIPGETRMRVSMEWLSDPVPCGNFDYGEVEDYTVFVNPPGIPIETGIVSQATSSWQTVNLQRNYTNMVVVAAVNYRTAEDTAVVRIRNATGNSFEMMIQNPMEIEIVGGYDVHYVVVEEGIYNVAEHGIKMEAILDTSSKTARKGKWVTEKRVYQNIYANPVVVGQVMTYNDEDWSVFWASSKKRGNPPDHRLYAGKHVGEDRDKTRADETIGYIVVEAGEGIINNIPFVAGVGPNIVRGYDNSSAGYLYNFTELTTANVAVVSSAGMNGGDGGWPVLLSLTPLTPTSLKLIIDEDQLRDDERLHGKEQVAFIIFGQ
jgi:PKD repeat protein